MDNNIHLTDFVNCLAWRDSELGLRKEEGLNNEKVIAPSSLHRPFGYAHAIQIEKTLYISGQVPLDMELKSIGEGDIAAQTEQVYANMQKVVEDAGGSMRSIVMLNIYCTDLDAYDKHTRSVRKKYFGDYYPATTAVEVRRLYRPEYMIEIEAVAVLDTE